MEKEISDLLKTEYIEKATKQWDGHENVTLIDDVENFVYDFVCEGKRRILRLTHSTHRSEDDIEAELDWINFLYDNDVKVSKPVPSKNMRFTEVTPVDDSYFVACVFERAPGNFVDTSNPHEWNTNLFRDWGKTIGKMHALTKKYYPKHLRKKRHEWYEDDVIINSSKYVPPHESQILKDLELTLGRIRTLPKTPDSYALVHNDLNPTNFFVDNGDITVFDFDDSCYNWFICDIATSIPLYSPIFLNADWKDATKEFFYHFLTGYNEENKIDVFWFEYLPTFLRLLNICSVIFSYKIDEKNRTLYNGFFEKVLNIYKNGHNLYRFNFHAMYESLGT